MGGRDFIPFNEKKLAEFLPKKKGDKKVEKKTEKEETKKSDTPSGKKANPTFDKYEKKLLKEQWLGGKEPTAADASAFKEIKS